MTTVTARIDEDTSQRLELLAKAMKRSRSWLVADAVKCYLDKESWQVAAIEEGVRQAETDNFADDDEVKAAFTRWGVNAD